MTAKTAELSVVWLVKNLGITEKQAKAGIRWVRAKKTRDLVRNERSGEELFQAQHELKENGVFPEHDPRAEFVARLTELYL